MSAEYIGNAYTPNGGIIGCGLQTPCPLAVCPGEVGCVANACAGAGCGANGCGANACAAALCAADFCIANLCAIDGCVVNLLPIPGPFSNGGDTM